MEVVADERGIRDEAAARVSRWVADAGDGNAGAAGMLACWEAIAAAAAGTDQRAELTTPKRVCEVHDLD